MRINQRKIQHYNFILSLSGCGGPDNVSVLKAIIMHLACHCEKSNKSD